MAEVTSRRDGWTGILMPEDLTITASAGDEAGAHVGPAEPATANAGDMVVRTLRSSRTAVQDDIVVRASAPGGMSRGRPAELVVQAEDGAAEHRWMDPVVSWGWAQRTSLNGPTRVARWGGVDYARTPVYSDVELSDSWQDVPHDIAPADDGELIAVWLLLQAGGWVVRSERWHVDDGVISTRDQVLPEVAITSDVRHVRVAWRDGEALLLVAERKAGGTHRDVIHQLASDDGGTGWLWVASTADYDGGVACSVADVVVSAHGQYVVAWASQSTDGVVRLGRAASAWEPVWAAGYAVTDSGTYWNAGTTSMVQGLRAALLAEESGALWLVASTYHATDDMEGRTWRSLDGGTTWTQSQGSVPHRWADWDSAVGRPDDFDATWLGLCALAIVDIQARTYAVRLGGWSQRGQAGALSGGLVVAGPTVGWRTCYHAVGIAPTSAGWSSSGLATATTGSASVSLTYGAGTRAGWRAERALNDSGSSAHTQHVIAVHHVAYTDADRVDEFAPIVIDLIACETTSTTTFGVRVAIGADELRIYHQSGAGTWAAGPPAVAHTLGEFLELYVVARFDFDAGTVQVRVVGRAWDGVEVGGLDGWVDLFSGDPAIGTDIYASVSASAVLWGGYVKSGETSAHYGTECTDNLLGHDPAWPADCNGRAIGPSGRMWVPQDALVEVVGGVAAGDDTWTIGHAWDHAAQELADPDPRRRWRSEGRTAATLTATHRAVGGPVYGIAIRGLVCEGLTVEVRNASSGTWSSVTISRTITGLQAGRIGTDVLRPAATSSTSLLLRRGELDGAWASYDGKAVPIERTLEGSWVHTSGVRQGSLQVNVDSGAASSGALEIYPTDLVLLVYSDATVIDGVRLTLAGASLTWPTGTVWSATHLLAGQVVIFGDDPDWGGAVRFEGQVELGESPDGRRRPRARGPGRRVVSLSWVDGIDTTRASEDSDSPDYIAHASGARAAAAPGATPWTVGGLYQQLQEGVRDVVLVRRIPMGTLGTGTLASYTLRRTPAFVHGHVDQASLQLDGVMGEEGVDEVIRLGTVTIREIT